MDRPAFASRAEYGARFTDPAYWQPYVAAICARHGLPGAPLRAGLPGTNPVFVVGEAYAVKLYSDLFGGAVSYPAERAMYDLIARHPGVPAPALVASGDLFEPGDGWPWPYVVTSAVPGRSAGESDLGAADRDALAGWLGPVVRGIHALPLAEHGPLRRSWDAFAAFLERQREGCAARHAAAGTLPPHLVAQIDAFVPPVDALVDRAAPPVALHCDLNADHVLGVAAAGGWQPRGVIDFGDARVGDPAYELPALHLGLFDGDPRLLRRFLAAYGPAPQLERDLARRAMAMALLHEFDVLGDLERQLPGASAARSLDELAARLWVGA